ncbi:MAG TPA: HlyD family efflux transporter periplasmic adaptor subunit [Cellulomonas sp.]
MTGATVHGLRRWTTTSFVAAVTLGALLLGWAGVARVDSAVSAPAVLAVPDDTITVQHPDGGQVVEVAVADGQRVTQGQTLLRLDTQGVDEQIAAARLSTDLLRVRLARLDAEIAGSRTVQPPTDLRSAPEVEPVATALSSAQARLDGWHASLDAQEDQLLGQASAAARAQVAAVRAAAALQSQIDRTEALDELAAAENGLTSLEAQHARSTVVAPADGTVFAARDLHVGRVVAVGETMLQIAPDGAALVAHAQIALADIDAVADGGTATVRFTTLDRAVATEATGRVVYLSPEPVTDESTGVASYPATIELSAQDLAALGTPTSLVPGMPVTVLLSAGDQTVLHYLLSPLTQRLGTALREP